MMKKTILIADDHSIIRKGLKLFIQLNLNYEDIDEVSSCSALMNELVKKKYTHLILDIILSDGNTLEVIPTIIKLFPDLQILVFSMQPTEIYSSALKHYNINHYLSKSESEEEMQQTLQAFLSNKISGNNKQNKLSSITNPFSSLAPRELEILHYMLKGLRTKEISETLNLKMSTVSTMKNRIYEKSNASNIKELIDLATLYNLNY